MAYFYHRMARIIRSHKRISLTREPEDKPKKYVEFGRIDRSRYPKPLFWMIFALCGAILLWLIARLALKLSG